MDLAEAIAYIGDALVLAAENRWAHLALAGVGVLLVASFLMGDSGRRLRRSMGSLALILAVGGLGTVTVIAVRGAPQPDQTAAAPSKTLEQKFDEWLASLRQDAARARRDTASPGERRKRWDVDVAGRLRDLAAERRQLQRQREEAERRPDTERTTDERRRAARAARRLATLDRDDGRLESALESYRSTLATLRRIAGPEARRAEVEATLEMAAALDARGREREAREAYKRAIAARREMAEGGEDQRRANVAGALLRYARFETGRHHNEPARAALVEAGDHYDRARAERGRLAVLRARGELANMVGDHAEARALIDQMHRLAARAGLEGEMGEIDLVAARVDMAEGKTEAAMRTFERAARRFHQAGERLDARRGLARALIGSAEAAFDLRRPALGRERVAAALAIYRKTGDRALAIGALARLALWEAAAGNPAVAERTLAAALGLQRQSGEARADEETERIVDVLCIGMLQSADVCRARRG